MSFSIHHIRIIFRHNLPGFPVEPVLGYATLARFWIALALSELVDEGWLPLSNAIDLTDQIIQKNASQVFRLTEKTVIPEHTPLR